MVSTVPSQNNSASRVDAITYTLLYRCWQAGAGFISILLIASHLKPVQQGFYYAFANLIALQSFLDLGLYLVVSVCASHEWSLLRLSSSGHIEGDTDARSRLVSLGRFLFKWYGTAAVIFWIAASLIGLHFFEHQQAPGINWRIPWLLHVGFSSALLWLTPFLSLLEGCDQYASASRFRLIQSAVSLLVFWFAVVGGATLWSIALMSGVSVLAILVYLQRGRWAFFSVFYAAPESAVLSWRHELLPMQWRLAVQGLFTYLSFPLYTTLTFWYDGPVEGGRIGMTLQIFSAVQSLATVLIATRAPGLAVAVATGDRDRLHADWPRATMRALMLMVLLLCVLIPAVALAQKYAVHLGQRVMPVPAFIAFGIATLLALLVQCMAIYMRAHKQERLTPVGALSGLMYVAAAWAVVRGSGPMGIALTHLIITALVTFPLTWLIFRACRREWYSAPTSNARSQSR